MVNYNQIEWKTAKRNIQNWRDEKKKRERLKEYDQGFLAALELVLELMEGLDEVAQKMQEKEKKEKEEI